MIDNYLLFDSLGSQVDQLTSDEKAIRVRAFHAILNGKSCHAKDLALQAGLSAERVQMSINSLVHKGLLVIDNSGTVVGSHGLSQNPTDHRLHINGRDLFTWCAIDAIGIPAALDSDAKIISKCTQCDDPIEITMAQGQFRHTNRKDIRIWVPEINIGLSIIGNA